LSFEEALNAAYNGRLVSRLGVMKYFVLVSDQKLGIGWRRFAGNDTRIFAISDTDRHATDWIVCSPSSQMGRGAPKDAPDDQQVT